MNFTSTTKLSDEKIEEIKEIFSEFYMHYVDTALSGQITFMSSVEEQFKARNHLSDKQIEAIKNVLDACDANEDKTYEY